MCKSLPVQMITCEVSYAYTEKWIGNVQPLSAPIPLARVSQLVKAEKYMADTDYFIHGADAVPILACSMVTAMMHKNSEGKLLIYIRTMDNSQSKLND